MNPYKFVLPFVVVFVCFWPKSSDGAVFVDPKSSRLGRSYWSAILLRGGDEDDVDVKTKANDEGKGKKQPLLAAPFRMNDLVKEEALIVDQPITTTDDDESSEEEDHATSKAPGLLVGGALVKTEPAKDSMGTSDVAPMSSRQLLEDPETANQKDNATPVSSSRNDVTDVAKLWWVNVWTQQLSDLEEESKPTRNATDLEENEFTEDQGVDTEESEGQSFEENVEEISSVDPRDEKIGDEFFSEVEDSVDVEVEDSAKIFDETESPVDKSKAPVEPEIAVNPFVSSGLVGSVFLFSRDPNNTTHKFCTSTLKTI